MFVAADPPPPPPPVLLPLSPPLPPLYFVVPNPEAELPPSPIAAGETVERNPPLARTPVVFDVGAALVDVLVLVFQFNQESPPVTPDVPAVVAPAPPDPIDVKTVAPGVKLKLFEIDVAPPPAPYIEKEANRPAPPPAPITIIVLLPDISAGTVQLVVPAVKRMVFVLISALSTRPD
jgi:hypothetical protein